MNKVVTNGRKIAKMSKATFIHDVTNILKNNDDDAVKVWQITSALANHHLRTNKTPPKSKPVDREDSYHLTEKLIPIILLADIIGEDVQPSKLGYASGVELLKAAIDEVLVGVPDHQAVSILRRSNKINLDILKKFSDDAHANTRSHAKMGLAAFHAVDRLRDEGLYAVVEVEIFDSMLTELFRDGSKLDTLHNIEAADKSAMKLGTRIYEYLREIGYYNE